MDFLDKKRNVVVAVLGTLLLIGVIFYFFPRFRALPDDYAIAKVPYRGLYETMPFDYPYIKDVAAALSSVFNYWHNYDQNLSDPSFEELDVLFPSIADVPMSRLADFYREKGFVAEVRPIEKLDDFSEFINDWRKTPIMVAQSVASGIRPAPGFNPYRVITGVSYTTQTVTVQDYFLGPDYKISFAEFRQLWGWGNSDLPQRPLYFLAVYPANYQEVLRRSPQANYLISRTPEMDLTAQMVKRWLLFKSFYNQGKFLESIQEGQEILESENVAYLPRILVGSIHLFQARAYNGLGEFQKALEKADIALRLGEEMGTLSLPSNPIAPGTNKNVLYFHLDVKRYSYLGLNDTKMADEMSRQMSEIQ